MTGLGYIRAKKPKKSSILRLLSPHWAAVCPPGPRVLPAWGRETAEANRCDENSLRCPYKAMGAAVVPGYALAAPSLRKCQLGSCPFCATGVPLSPVLPREPSELSAWSSQASWGCCGSPSWPYCWVPFQPSPPGGCAGSPCAGRRKGGDCWNWPCCVHGCAGWGLLDVGS